MKKLTVLCLLIVLIGMLSVSSTLATSETQQTNPLTAFFETVVGILDNFGKDPETGENLKIKTIFQTRDISGGIRDGNDNYLQAVDTASLSASDQVEINGISYAFWPLSSGATDKIVSVKNIADKKVYFRTALLFKCSQAVWKNIALNRNTKDYIWNEESVDIDGVSYPMLIATYCKSLSKDQVSAPMLLQLAVDESVVGEMDTLGFETQTFAIEAEAFGEDSAEEALDKAIPIENIVRSFKPATDP